MHRLKLVKTQSNLQAGLPMKATSTLIVTIGACIKRFRPYDA